MSDVQTTAVRKSETAGETSNGAMWTGVLAVLGFCAVALTVVPLLRLKSFVSLNYNEGWNAYRDQMAAHHVPLYSSPPGFGITNYPFLSFHIIGFVSRLTGDVNVTGRIIASLSLVAVCFLIAGIVRQLQGSWRAGIYAALCFFVWLATYAPAVLGVNDPQLLGMAFSTLGVYAYVQGPQRTAWLALSAVAFVVAVFTKDNLIAFPLAIGVHLVLQRRWRDLLLWAGIGTAVAFFLLLLTFRLDGPFFFSHLLRSRSAAYGRGQLKIVQLLERFYAPFVIGIGWLVWAERSASRKLLFIAFTVSFPLALIFVFGNGVGENIFFDTLIVVALATAIAVTSLEGVLPRAPWARAVFAIVIALPALSGIVQMPFALADDRLSWRSFSVQKADTAHGVALLKEVSGPVLCESLLLCYYAGKPMLYDAYFVHDQIRTRHIPENEVLAQIETQYYRAIEVDAGIEGPPKFARERNRFTAAFMHDLLSRYHPVFETPAFTIFRPR